MAEETLRAVEIYLDVDGLRLVDSDTELVIDPVEMYRQTRLILRCHLVHADGSVFTPPTNASWFFAIDFSFDPDHDDLVVTQNADFNQASYWSTLDVANGKIAWLVNTATTQLKDAMEKKPFRDMYGLLMMTPLGEDPLVRMQFPVRMFNIVGEIESDTPLVYTLSTLLRADGNETVLYLPDGTEVRRWD